MLGYQHGDVVVINPSGKMLQVFDDMLARKGMIPLRLLMYAGPAGCAQHAHRWQCCMQSRQKKALVCPKQINHAVTWLCALVQEVNALRPGMPLACCYNRARSSQIGVYLMIAGECVAYWRNKVSGRSRVVGCHR